MKIRILLSLVLVFVTAATGRAQESNLSKGNVTPAEADRIIKKATENEREFRGALTQYVFNRNATIQIIGMGGQVTGQYRRDSFMSLLEDGRRFEKILFFPVATTPPGFVTPEDLEDLGGVNPFALEPGTIQHYNFTYLGKERIDELDLFVFEVVPKAIPDPKKTNLRLFTGRIWVDATDLMIVKSKGKAVPETKKNKFPVVETWRENIDGKYWFPSFASSDDELVFDDGSVVKLRIRIKYVDYRQGRTDVKILDEVEEVKEPVPAPTPKKP